MKMYSETGIGFGNNIRDNALQFEIDKEVGHKITATVNADARLMTISLVNKFNSVLASVDVPIDNTGKKYLTNAILDTATETITFYSAEEEGTGILCQCDLTNLFNVIRTEAQTRAIVDGQLADRITAETTARESADIVLTDAINSEKSRAEAVEVALGNRITNEATIREAADNTLQANINAEKERAIAAENTKVTSKIGNAYIFNEADGGGAKFVQNNGTSSFVGVNNSAGGQVAGQLYVVSDANPANGCKINLEYDKFTYIKNKATSERTADDEIAVVGQVNAEKTRAQIEEASIRADLAAEATARALTDGQLSDRITIETNRATAAEQAEHDSRALQDGILSNKIEAETNRATAAENFLNADLNAEIIRATGVETDIAENVAVVRDDLEEEVIRAKAAEETLTNNLNAEIVRAKAAEEAEEAARIAAVAAEEAARIAADNTINNNLYGDTIPAYHGQTEVKLIGEDHKIPTGLLPDFILGQLLYGGNVEKVNDDILAYPTASLKAKLVIEDDTIKIVNRETDDLAKSPKEYGYKTLQGVYFLARTDFEVIVGTETTSFKKGDWLIGAGTYWDKIDNTDAVTSVNGQIGAVELDYDDVGAASKTEYNSLRNLFKGDYEHTGTEPIRIPYYFDVQYDTGSVDVTARGVYLDQNDNIHWEPTEHSITINSATNTTAGLMSSQDKIELAAIRTDLTAESTARTSEDTRVLFEAKAYTDVEADKKVDLPIEPVAGQGLNVPYYFSVAYSADKATVTDYTIDLLDKSKAPQTFTLDINAATTETAGLMSSIDKSTLDAVATTYLPLAGGTMNGNLKFVDNTGIYWGTATYVSGVDGAINIYAPGSVSITSGTDTKINETIIPKNKTLVCVGDTIIKIGNTNLDEEHLKKLLALLDTMEAE